MHINDALDVYLLHTSETWLLKVEDTIPVGWNKNMMIRWVCSTKLSIQKVMFQLRDMLRIHNIKDVLCLSQLGWFGYFEHTPNDN